MCGLFQRNKLYAMFSNWIRMISCFIFWQISDFDRKLTDLKSHFWCIAPIECDWVAENNDSKSIACIFVATFILTRAKFLAILLPIVTIYMTFRVLNNSCCILTNLFSRCANVKPIVYKDYHSQPLDSGKMRWIECWMSHLDQTNRC